MSSAKKRGGGDMQKLKERTKWKRNENEEELEDQFKKR